MIRNLLPRHIIPAFALALLALLAAPTFHSRAAADDTTAAAASSGDTDVIARIGDKAITVADMRADIAALDAQTQASIAKDPQALAKVVRAILAQKLVLKEALDKKWDDDPAVTAALDRLRDSAIAQTYLQHVSQPPTTYPSDTEVQTVYDNNKSKLVIPHQYDLAQIFVKDAKGSDKETEAKAQAKVATIKKALAKSGADFAAIATADSDEPQSAAKGGEIGLIPDSSIQPAIRSQIGSLSKGGVSGPIRLDDGYHFIKVLDEKASRQATLDEVKASLIQRMRQAQSQQLSQQYLAKLLQDNPVQMNELALPKILKTGP
jgi:parvulin-like peptidyl-prolyl isomerase